MAGLGHALQAAWMHRGLLARLLYPVSLAYASVVALRRALYRAGWLVSQPLDCAVLVVGNAIVGGAGKTPCTMAIVQHLRQRGLQVGVVSRGYGRSAQSVLAVEPTSDAHEVGDEPLLIRRATGVPVWVAPARYQAARALLAAHPSTDIIVCDDGLQHYALARDIEVCVFDDRGIGNGWLLPSGPLREPWPRAPLPGLGQQHGLVLHTGAHPPFAGYRAPRALASYALARDGQQCPLTAGTQPTLALAGIAKPEAFFSALRAQGVVLDQTLALPDHDNFDTLDLAALQGRRVLCTEKDAVKLWQRLPTALAVPLLQSLEPAFLRALDQLLDPVLATKLSSKHGHQTA